MADFQTGKTITPLTEVDDEIFFQDEMSLPIGGESKRHSRDQFAMEVCNGQGELSSESRAHGVQKKERLHRVKGGPGRRTSKEPVGNRRRPQKKRRHPRR